MPVNRCRICGSALFGEPLLRYRNMPGAAQHLPDAASLAADQGADLDVCQCSACGMVQLANDPVPYWREVIRATAFSPEMGNFRQEQFRDFVRKYALAGKKVVEIGCGRGEYLSLMRQAGAEVYGVEFGAESARQCIRDGLPVEQGFVGHETTKLAHAPFAAFFILNFLEHLPDPNAVLRGVRNNLAAGAVGLVEVPNFDMILRKNLFSEFIGDHLFYFTKATLNATLERNGFDIVTSEEIWHDYIISTVVRKRSSFDVQGPRPGLPGGIPARPEAPRLPGVPVALTPPCNERGETTDKQIEQTSGRTNTEPVCLGNGRVGGAQAAIPGRCQSHRHSREAAPQAGIPRHPLDLSGFASHQARLKAELEAYIARFGVGKVAVWGAGHQALAVLALAELGGKIRYVVDSAPFKQGKYTPATHLPIVSPEALAADPVEAVIVMAAAYSAEVAGIIRRKFGNRMAVAILHDSGLVMS